LPNPLVRRRAHAVLPRSAPCVRTGDRAIPGGAEQLVERYRRRLADARSAPGREKIWATFTDDEPPHGGGGRLAASSVVRRSLSSTMMGRYERQIVGDCAR